MSYGEAEDGGELWRPMAGPRSAMAVEGKMSSCDEEEDAMVEETAPSCIPQRRLAPHLDALSMTSKARLIPRATERWRIAKRVLNPWKPSPIDERPRKEDSEVRLIWILAAWNITIDLGQFGIRLLSTLSYGPHMVVCIPFDPLFCCSGRSS
nr:hypothetical protein Iba_chr03aCG7860 [Ipomoea batatas]